MRRFAFLPVLVLLLSSASSPVQASCNHAAPSFSTAGEGLLADPLVLLASLEERLQSQDPSQRNPEPAPCIRCGGAQGVPVSAPFGVSTLDLLGAAAEADARPPFRPRFDQPDQLYERLLSCLVERPPRWI